VTTPQIDGLLTSPYITVPEFLAAPTWLDNQDLIPGGVQGQQTGELYNVLLRASGWACRIAEQPLHAHTVFDQDRFPVDRWGNITIVPPHNPVRQVNAVAYGSDFQNMSLISNLEAQLWIEKQKTIKISQVPQGGAYLGSLQFGGTRPGADEVYVQYSYVAGYCSTVLTAAATSGTSELTVADPTGLQPPVTFGLVGTAPGSVARIWDPVNAGATTGGEEAVQVATGWTAGSNPVQLAGNLVNNHAIGAGVSEMPPEVHQAIWELTVALLMRDDVSDEEPFSGTPFGPTLRESRSGGKAGGLVDHAREVLLRYRPTVH
jgi:hypothetical protein